VHHNAPAGPVLLIERINLKRHARRLGQLRQDVIRGGAEVSGSLVHGVGDRKDLREISGLPPNAAQMMGLHEIKALLAAQCLEMAL
jgi:hypothetical protein